MSGDMFFDVNAKKLVQFPDRQIVDFVCPRVLKMLDNIPEIRIKGAGFRINDLTVLGSY